MTPEGRYFSMPLATCSAAMRSRGQLRRPRPDEADRIAAEGGLVTPATADELSRTVYGRGRPPAQGWTTR